MREYSTGCEKELGIGVGGLEGYTRFGRKSCIDYNYMCTIADIRRGKQLPEPKSDAGTKVSQLVSWCFEPSQPQRITSGLRNKGVHRHETFPTTAQSNVIMLHIYMPLIANVPIHGFFFLHSEIYNLDSNMRQHSPGELSFVTETLVFELKKKSIREALATHRVESRGTGEGHYSERSMSEWKRQAFTQPYFLLLVRRKYAVLPPTHPSIIFFIWILNSPNVMWVLLTENKFPTEAQGLGHTVPQAYSRQVQLQCRVSSTSATQDFTFLDSPIA